LGLTVNEDDTDYDDEDACSEEESEELPDTAAIGEYVLPFIFSSRQFIRLLQNVSFKTIFTLPKQNASQRRRGRDGRRVQAKLSSSESRVSANRRKRQTSRSVVEGLPRNRQLTRSRKQKAKVRPVLSPIACMIALLFVWRKI
jgi:hypothetical protein